MFQLGGIAGGKDIEVRAWLLWEGLGRAEKVLWEGLESRALRTLQAVLRNLSFTLSDRGPLQTFEQRNDTP